MQSGKGSKGKDGVGVERQVLRSFVDCFKGSGFTQSGMGRDYRVLSQEMI